MIVSISNILDSLVNLQNDPSDIDLQDFNHFSGLNLKKS
jgi:hypothetical protein